MSREPLHCTDYDYGGAVVMFAAIYIGVQLVGALAGWGIVQLACRRPRVR